jgi:hypothetical protein
MKVYYRKPVIIGGIYRLQVIEADRETGAERVHLDFLGSARAAEGIAFRSNLYQDSK